MTEDVLTYNTPCSEEILKQINLYEIERLQENAFSKNKTFSFCTSFCLVLGIFMFFYKISFGYFLLGRNNVYQLVY
jgi:hypothetical protein